MTIVPEIRKTPSSLENFPLAARVFSPAARARLGVGSVHISLLFQHRQDGIEQENKELPVGSDTVGSNTGMNELAYDPSSHPTEIPCSAAVITRSLLSSRRRARPCLSPPSINFSIPHTLHSEMTSLTCIAAAAVKPRAGLGVERSRGRGLLMLNHSFTRFFSYTCV